MLNYITEESVIGAFCWSVTKAGDREVQLVFITLYQPHLSSAHCIYFIALSGTLLHYLVLYCTELVLYQPHLSSTALMHLHCICIALYCTITSIQLQYSAIEIEHFAAIIQLSWYISIALHCNLCFALMHNTVNTLTQQHSLHCSALLLLSLLLLSAAISLKFNFTGHSTAIYPYSNKTKWGRYWEIHPQRPRKISRVSGNLLGVGDGFPNTSFVLVEHGYNLKTITAQVSRYQRI